MITLSDTHTDARDRYWQMTRMWSLKEGREKWFWFGVKGWRGGETNTGGASLPLHCQRHFLGLAVITRRRWHGGGTSVCTLYDLSATALDDFFLKNKIKIGLCSLVSLKFLANLRLKKKSFFFLILFNREQRFWKCGHKSGQLDPKTKVAPKSLINVKIC